MAGECAAACTAGMNLSRRSRFIQPSSILYCPGTDNCRAILCPVVWYTGHSRARCPSLSAWGVESEAGYANGNMIDVYRTNNFSLTAFSVSIHSKGARGRGEMRPHPIVALNAPFCRSDHRRPIGRISYQTNMYREHAKHGRLLEAKR